jgi:hypothetical protein
LHAQLLDVLFKRARVQVLLHDGPASVGLQVEHVLHPANAAMPTWK